MPGHELSHVYQEGRNLKIQYKIQMKELDEKTDYPVDVLAGMTGLGFNTIDRLAAEGHFSFGTNSKGQRTVNGKEFIEWSESVGNTIEVEKTEYPVMKVDE
jgi:hypothetical protein